MTEPSGKIVARPLVARACGHEQEFQHYEVDKYRPQRLAKFQATRCAACVAQLHEERRRAAVPSSVQALALRIYDERAFDRLPQLADALQTAGCHDAEVLGHLHSPGPHVRGCWVVDAVLCTS